MLEDTYKSGNINNVIYNEIKNCSFIIADISSFKKCIVCSERVTTIKKEKKRICNHINNNVIYEIGLAHAFKKKVIIILDKIKKIIDSQYFPFDISSHNTLEYNSIDSFNKSIKKSIENTITEIDEQ